MRMRLRYLRAWVCNYIFVHAIGPRWLQMRSMPLAGEYEKSTSFHDFCERQFMLEIEAEPITLNPDSDPLQFGYIKRAVYRPKNLKAVPVDMHPLIGQTFSWQFSLRGGPHDIKANQGRWYPIQDVESEFRSKPFDPRFGNPPSWVPDEDLEDIPS